VKNEDKSYCYKKGKLYNSAMEMFLCENKNKSHIFHTLSIWSRKGKKIGFSGLLKKMNSIII
jgi:hypothetical protein